MKFNWCIFLILLCIGVVPGIIYAILCSKKREIIIQQMIVNIQQPEKYCPNCHIKIDPKHKFCKNCGLLINH